jgi:hypothetical protein
MRLLYRFYNDTLVAALVIACLARTGGWCRTCPASESYAIERRLLDGPHGQTLEAGQRIKV